MANRSALSRATDSSDAPTPGYLYLDIAKNAASSPVACQEIATYLTRRLASKNSPNIKFKCLKVIAKTAESPVTRGQFKRSLCQDPQAVGAIKEALQFRGQPDPARGDERNARVRTAAKEALDAVYSDTPSSAEHSSANAGLSSGGGASYASSSTAHHAAPPANSARRMEGIGNPMFQDPRNGPPNQGLGNMTIGQVVNVAGETIVGMIKDPLAKNVEQPPPHHSSMPGYGSGGAYGAPPPGSSQLARQTGGEWTMASNRGPQSVIPPAQSDSSEYYKARDAAGSNAFSWAQQQQQQQGKVAVGGGGGGVGGSWGGVSTAVPASAGGSQQPSSVASQARAPAHGGNFAAPTNASGAGGTAVSDGSFEKNLIMELCPPGGMKAEPPPDKLASFARSVPSLNPDFVCPALLDALEDGQPWIIRAKALCVMEVTILVSERHKGEGQTNAYADFFHACRGEIEPLASHPRAAIRDPAKRVLKALGIESNVASAAPPASAPPPPTPVPNLLDFDNDAPVAAPPPAAPPAQPAKEEGSLFGGMQVKSTTKDTPPSGGGLLDNTKPATNTTPVAAGSGGGGLFGDVKVKETTTAAAEAKDVGKAAATTGSAFGFINGGGGDVAPPAEAAAKEEAKAAPATKQSFDPLLSLGTTTTETAVSPNTAHKHTMQLSTDQMQAMAYQQMMMQQQMQMQQMQMAMAMQQQMGAGGGGGGGVPGMMPQPMPRQGSHRTVMNMNSGAAASSSFSFLDTGSKPPPKEDKEFDFVKDALKSESKK